MKKINYLILNSYLKNIEFILHKVDSSEGKTHLSDIKEQFREKFKCNIPILLNQYFGIIRLIPLMYITENGRFDESDRKMLIVIRNAFAHDDIYCDNSGYTFKANRAENQDVSMTYSEFNVFIHRIENFSYNNI